MSDIKDRLQSMLGDKGLMTGAEWRRKADDLARRRAEGEFEIDKVVPGEDVGEEDARFYLVRTDLGLDTQQGHVALGAALDAIPEHIALSACDSELEAFDPATTAFMDTETTGLAGGAGTVAFLVGVGFFTNDGFRLEQCFMRDYDEEEPMLRYLDGLFKRFETVVSYNGKSFDLPLLRTRFIQNRIPFRLDSAMHFDLVHAARRFWKRRLADCALGTIEREVLGVMRHGDVPSAEIPQIWFDYLRTRDARKLGGVFYHHKMDILSLVTLTGWLSQCLAKPQGQGFEHVEDRLSLVRLHFRQKQYDEVLYHGNRLLEAEPEAAIRRECLELMCFAGKRRQDYVQMKEALELLLQEFPKDLVARLELAKLHEHRTRNLFEAERICQETIQFLETRIALGRDTDLDESQLVMFRHRLERVQRKLSKAGRKNKEEEE
jgi:uncharacterized protein YprB with RNaseH-like and TPR domain